jgi:hypothetical protein
MKAKVFVMGGHFPPTVLLQDSIAEDTSRGSL